MGTRLNHCKVAQMNSFIAGVVLMVIIVIVGAIYGWHWLTDKFNNREQ